MYLKLATCFTMKITVLIIVFSYHNRQIVCFWETHETYMKIKVYGKIHPVVSITLHNLAVWSIYSNWFEQALKYSMEALSVPKSLLDSSDIKIVLSLLKVAIILYTRQCFKSSLASFREALQIMCKVVRCDHPSIIKSP